MADPKTHFAPLAEKVKNLWFGEGAEFYTQWGPKSVTFVVRRENADGLADKVTWAHTAAQMLIELAPACYASFNANRKVASCSAMFWLPGEEL